MNMEYLDLENMRSLLRSYLLIVAEFIADQKDNRMNTLRVSFKRLFLLLNYHL